VSSTGGTDGSIILKASNLASASAYGITITSGLAGSVVTQDTIQLLNLSADTYTIIVSDTTVNGVCADTVSIVITEPQVQPLVPNVTIQGFNLTTFQNICNDTVAIINAVKEEEWLNDDTPIILPNATLYSFLFIDVLTNDSIEITSTTDKLALDTAITLYGLNPLTKYEVRIKAQIAPDWGDYSGGCPIITPEVFIPVPPTGLNSNFCNTILASLTDSIVAIEVNGASEYEWQLNPQGASSIITVKSTNNKIVLDTINNLIDGETYIVRVRATVGGRFGDYASECAITLPSNITVPLTRLNDSLCNSTLDSVNQNLYAIPVPQVQSYRWLVVSTVTGDTITEYERLTASNDYNLTWELLPIAFGETYEISIAAKVGNAWGAYGNMCLVTVPAEPNSIKENTFLNSMRFYPNPLEENLLNINIGNTLQYDASLYIYNSIGVRVYHNTIAKGTENIQIETDLTTGVYTIVIEGKDGTNVQKLIKQ